MKTLLEELSPRGKLGLALGLVLGLGVLAPWGGVSAAALARGVLGLVALGALGGWLLRQGQAGSRFSLTERMRVVSRTGLSPRCGLALVEVEGRSYLVAFGDGFAEIRPARVPTRWRSRPRRRAGASAWEKERLS